MSIGLALSGGAALGIAHIGVIKYLEEKKIKPACLAGTSAGSIVAALYCAGFTVEEMAEIALNFSWKEVARPAVPRWGLIDSSYLEKMVGLHLGSITFADLKIPLFINAVDLAGGREVVLSEGPVAAAVKASCAIPGIFTPARLKGRLLVDGGVLNNVPAGLLKEKRLEKIIAVDLGSQKPLLKRPQNIFEVLMQTLFIIQRAQRQSCRRHADLLVEPALGDFTPWDVSRAGLLIERGYEACRDTLGGL